MTPREEFVLPEDRDHAYVGHYLDIGFGVTITAARRRRADDQRARHRPGDKVLEIGTGSGYQSALLSYLTDRLWTIEIIPELAARTRGIYDALIAKGYREYERSTPRTPMATTAGRTPRPSTRSSSPAASTTSRRRYCSN